MRKAFFLSGLCLCTGLYGHLAQAAYVTGADLAKNCRSDNPVEIFSCLNYVAGVIDYQVIMQSLGTAPTVDFCLPEELPIERAAASVMDYLQASPEHASFIAAPAVAMALHAAYPCGPIQKKKKKNGG